MSIPVHGDPKEGPADDERHHQMSRRLIMGWNPELRGHYEV